jgi:hypothetical protein
MSQNKIRVDPNVRIIDGLTGDLIGGGSTTGYGQSGYQQTNYGTSSGYGYPSGGVVTNTTTQYVPTPSYGTTGYSTVGHAANYGATTYQTTVGGGSRVLAGGSTYVHGQQQQSQIVNTVVNMGREVIKGESRIEYVPFEKKVVDYRDEVIIEQRPITRTVTEYREEKRIENVPREVVKTDYYAVEYLRQYIPQYIPEKTVEYVARERKVKKYDYIPVERQIVHYPEQPLEEETVRYQGGSAVRAETVTYTGNQQVGSYATGGYRT